MKAFAVRWLVNAVVLLLAAGSINGQVAANAAGDPSRSKDSCRRSARW